MNILIIGSTGGTGRCLVQEALDQGHKVTAFARNPASISTSHPNLAVVEGDVLDYSTVDEAVQGQDAVLSALGTKTLGKSQMLSDGTKNIITAMEKWDVKRFICETSLGVGDSKGQIGALFDWVLIPVMFRNVFQDKETQEDLIKQSHLEWTIVRPGRLTDGPRTGDYHVIDKSNFQSSQRKISRADVADFMLHQLDDYSYALQTPGLSY